MQELKVLELFAGIGACSKALERLNIPHKIVDAVEIDKYAIQSFNAIHGTNFEPQDICKWDKNIDVDLIMQGSPCQDFSLAGKQAGGDEGSGTRSSLMYETLRIVGKLKPKYVVWENVKNLLSKKHRHNFDAYLETMEQLGYANYYQVLNAKDYGIPQNRERVFTISIRNDLNQTFVFPPKQELKLKLKDMLEDEVDEKYYLSDTQVNRIKTSTYTSNNRMIQKKDYCDTLCARDWKDPKCVQVDFVTKKYNEFIDEKGYMPDMYNPYNNSEIKDIAPTQSTQCGSTTSSSTVLIRNKSLRETLEQNNIEKDISFIDSYNRNIRKDDLSGTITTRVSDSNNTFIAIKNATKQGYLEAHDGDGCYISNIDKKRGTVQREMIPKLKTSPDIGCVTTDLRIRKLTPKECWRLMGFDDEDFEKASFKKETSYIEGDLKCNAKLKIVNEKQRHLDMETYVLCTTNDMLDMETPIRTKWKKSIENENNEKMQNVNIAIEMLDEVEQKECVTNIIKCGENITILYTLMEELDQCRMAIIELGKRGKANIEKYMKITLEENLNPMKLYTISTLIEQIIKSKIYTCITQKANIQGNIAIIEDCVKNLKMMKLSNLKMEYITRLNSDTMLYKQAGNSIVVTVLEEIFTELFKEYIPNLDKWSDLD